MKQKVTPRPRTPNAKPVKTRPAIKKGGGGKTTKYLI